MTHSVFAKIASLIILTIIISSCSGKRIYTKGKEAISIGEYYKGTEKFKKAYRKVKDPDKRMEMAYELAKSYHQLGEYNRAAIWYKNAIRRGHPNDSIIILAAESLRASQKFDEAKEYYNLYLEKKPYSTKALDGIEACDSIKSWEKKPSRYKIEHLKAISSRESDYSAIYTSSRGNEIIFSSMREHEQADKSINSITGQRFSNVFQANYDLQKQKWETPVPIDDRGAINTLDEEGAASFSPSGDMLVFTRCATDTEKNMGAAIYSSAIARGNFSEAKNLNIVPDSLIAAHPYFSMTGDTLFFTSDINGSIGGTDIWMSIKSGGSFGKPINLGEPINTRGNESFPTTDNNGNLFFSSDYHPGFGGLDIFKANKDENGNWQVENMKSPINSAGDDFAMTFLPNNDYPKGLFSSNRKGTRRDDIFTFELPPMEFNIKGKVYNKDTKQAIDGARIRVIATDGTDLRIRANDGEFKINLKAETEYIFAAYQDKYLNDKTKVSTIDLKDSKTFDIEFFLTPINEPIRVDNINYAFGSSELEESSKQALDTVVQILKTNPTITIELMSHSDHIGSAQANSLLSQKRAQSVVDYLILKGINANRLVAKGYGETWPKEVDELIAKQYSFLKKGNILNEQFINSLNEEQQEIARSINRRTEFRVLSTDYQEKFKE